MRGLHTYSHRDGKEIAEKQGVLQDVIASVNVESFHISRNSGAEAKKAILESLISCGWAPNPQVDARIRIDVNAMKNGIWLTAQTGNIARAFYDLIKFQHLFISGRSRAAVHILPARVAAQTIGSNIAYFERVRDELLVFESVITSPLLIIAFE